MHQWIRERFVDLCTNKSKSLVGLSENKNLADQIIRIVLIIYQKIRIYLKKPDNQIVWRCYEQVNLSLLDICTNQSEISCLINQPVSNYDGLKHQPVMLACPYTSQSGVHVTLPIRKWKVDCTWAAHVLQMDLPLKQWAAQWIGATHCLYKLIIIYAHWLHMSSSVGRTCPLTFNLIIIPDHWLPIGSSDCYIIQWAAPTLPLRK